MRWLGYLAIGIAFSAPALACDCVRLIPTGPNFDRDLDAIAKYYPIAAEGVLEADGQYAWRFRPTHEYRGLGKASYRIDLISDCTLGPNELALMVGKPVFVLLSGDNDRYEISRCVNFLGADIDKAIRTRIGAGCKPR